MRRDIRIGHYEVEELLGRGGMGEVYRATDRRLDRPVALKLLNSAHVADPEARERFIREAKAASALDHPNICTIHDVGETDAGELYMVMAFYEGRTLEARLEDETFPEHRVLAITRQLAQALKRAHESGIVHRDLKPANVMVGPDDAVRLLDFGIAKLQAGTALTRTGATLGTAAYMSPEQAAGDPVSAATDVWALGVIGYRMLTGRLPFEAENPLARLNQILTADPPAVADLVPGVSPLLADAIGSALMKDAAARPADGAALLALLEGADRPRDTDGARVPRATGSRRRSWAVATAVLAVGAVAWFGLQSGDSVGEIGAADGLPPAAPAAEDALVVLPFAVTGEADFAYLAEGMMDLLSARLDGAGPLRTVDPRTVVGILGPDAAEGVAEEDAERVATELGAGAWVTGRLLALPGGLSLSARIGRPGGDLSPIVAVEGEPDSLFVLVDQLAGGLLGHAVTGDDEAILRTATATSASVPATREFLTAEQHHRSGQFELAAAAYNRALALDSTFALAHLMKSMNNAYTYETDDLEAAEKAMLHSEGLPDRYRSLIEAFVDQQSGRVDEAENRYLAHLRRWPDEVKAMWQLGRLNQDRNPRLGLPMAAARPWLERVLEYEPGNVPALHTLSRIAGAEGRSDEVMRHALALERVAPGTEWAVETRSMAAFATEDGTWLRQLEETFTRRSVLERIFALYNALRFSPDPDWVDRLASLDDEASNTEVGLPDGTRVEGDLSDLGDYTRLVALLSDVAQGRHGKVRAWFADPVRPPRTRPAWTMWEAELAVSGAVDVGPELLEGLLERVESVDPATRMDRHFEPLHDVFTPQVAALERDALRARLLARLGRIDEAWTIQRRVAAGPDHRGFASLRDDVAGALAADLHALAGEPDEALRILRELRFQVASTASSLAITNGTQARILRARLEAERGDPEVALELWHGIQGTFSATVKIALAEAWLQLGRLHEQAGDSAEALRFYDRFLAFRAGADPELAAEVEEVRQQRQALGGSAEG